MGPGDVSDHPICIYDVFRHSGDPYQVLSEDDLPPEVRVVDLPPEVRISDLLPEVRVVDLPPEVWINDLPPEVRVVDLPPEVRLIDLPPEVRIIDLPLGVRAVDLTPEEHVVDLPSEGRVDAASTVMPTGSARMSPCSSGNSPDLPDAEPVLEVSPDTSGFLMRPSGAAMQPPVTTLCSHLCTTLVGLGVLL